MMNHGDTEARSKLLHEGLTEQIIAGGDRGASSTGAWTT